MKHFLLSVTFLLLSIQLLFSRHSEPARLKVFIDCSNTWCDMQHIRSEINIVDFLYDNIKADVHVLITGQFTGSGGYQYQLIFFGQHSFHRHLDTLQVTIAPDATDFEERDILLKYIKAGLIPFIAKTSNADFEINLTSSDTADVVPGDSSTLKDPWNGWVLRLGGDLYINEDAIYKNTSYSGNFSANRILEKIKTGAGVFWNNNKSIFEFEDNGETESFIVNNHQWSVSYYFVKSITEHWSWASDIRYSQNTFSNFQGRAFAWIASEYNVFPYKEVNNKLLTLAYGLTARNHNYYDTTIYNKTSETLFGHRASMYLSFNQKWGNTDIGVFYHNYFHDWSLYNLGVDMYANVRITGGLSFYMYAFGGLTRDQIFLVKGNATPEEVLARRRQLASGYNYYTSIGLSYRFGSTINNVVNPRFDRTGSRLD